MSRNVLVIAGDGIGPEITIETRRVLDAVNEKHQLGMVFDEALLGGAALDAGVDSILAATAGRPHIFNLGHGITPDTPIAHGERLIGRIRG